MKNLKTRITVLTFLITLLTIKFTSGQENENARSKFGIGVSLFNITQYEFENDFSNSIYMTIGLGNNFRLEPTIGFVFANGYESYSIGLGAFGRKPISKFDILYGARLGLINGETLFIAPTLGGEYYFIKNFSIGSEIQLRGTKIDEVWGLMTNSSVIVRFYF